MASPYASPLTFPFASSLFGFKNGAFGYMIPKPKFLYYVEFVINESYQLQPSEWNRLGYLVKSVDRPKIQYKAAEVDQYNRKRIVYTKVDYGQINITFYDTVDNAATKMIDDYNRFHINDFSNQSQSDDAATHTLFWKDNTITGSDMQGWGYRLKNPNGYSVGNESTEKTLPYSYNYFREIRVYEFFGNNFTMFTILNPKIETVSFSPTDISTSDTHEISLMVNPEGIVYNYIDAPVTASQLASSYLPGPGFTTNNFPIANLDLFSYFLGSVTRSGGIASTVANGIFGSLGALNNTSGIGSAVGIIGGTAISAAASGLLGRSLTKIVNPQNLFFANSFLSTASMQSTPVLTSNIVKGLSTITGTTSRSLALAAGKSSNIGVTRMLNSISSLF